MTKEDQLKDAEEYLDELKGFLAQAVVQRTKNFLTSEIKKVESEIAAIKFSIAQQASPQKSSQSSTQKRFVSELSGHAFDQSEKYVKIFIPFNEGNITEESVDLAVTEDSFKLFVRGEKKDYKFNVINLLKKVSAEKSYKKVKPDMISIYLKKVKDGEKWDCLTVTEKRLKDQKNKAFEENKDEAGSDPMGGLMNIMKKMYDSGDSEMKRTIAKAWTEGQDKQRGAPNPF